VPKEVGERSFNDSHRPMIAEISELLQNWKISLAISSAASWSRADTTWL
jgi:hypothetical protein